MLPGGGAGPPQPAAERPSLAMSVSQSPTQAAERAKIESFLAMPAGAQEALDKDAAAIEASVEAQRAREGGGKVARADTGDSLECDDGTQHDPPPATVAQQLQHPRRRRRPAPQDGVLRGDALGVALVPRRRHGHQSLIHI